MQCSPSLEGQTKRPYYMLAPATPTILGFTAREMSQLPTRLRGRGHRNPGLRGRSHRNPPPPLKFPHTRYLGQRAAEKPSTFLAIFMGLSLTPITNIWSAS